MRRLLALLALLMAIFSLWTGVTIHHARRSEAYACLVFSPALGYYNTAEARPYKQLDLNNGITLNVASPISFYQPALPNIISTSDGNYQIGLASADSLTLQAQPSAGGPPIVLSERLYDTFSYTVAPKSNWISYVEYDRATEQYLLYMARFKADGSLERRQRLLPDFMRSFTWSPDGLAFLYSATGTARLELWRLDSNTFTPVDLPAAFFDSQTMLWGSDGRLVYMFNSVSEAWLLFLLPDGRGGYTQQIRPVHSSFVNTIRLGWSPDERYVLAQYILNDTAAPQIDLWASDGSSRISLNKALAKPYIGAMEATWTEDGQSVLILVYAGIWDVYRYDLVGDLLGRKISTLYKDLWMRPNLQNNTPAGQNRRLAVKGEAVDRVFYLEMLDTDGENVVRLVENANAMSYPYWSPDGRYLAVVWSTGQQARRVLRLTVAHANGQVLQTLDNGLWDARDLFWQNDALYFVGVRAGPNDAPAFSLERLPLDGGAAEVISGGFGTLGLLKNDFSSDEISFWWRSPEGSLGVSAFSGAGQGRYRFEVGSLPPNSKIPLAEAPLLRNEVFYYQPGLPDLTWRPQHPSEALIKLGASPNEQLYWVNRAGQWRLLREGLTGLGKPVWSPDGQYFAITQSRNYGKITLAIFTGTGQVVREEDRFPGFYRELAWSTCQ
jgi:Tol biopolymer transport system component